VISVGEQVPEAEVWRSTRDRLDLRELASQGPYLLFFYLFDWSST
jgi:peroxiredoxin